MNFVFLFVVLAVLYLTGLPLLFLIYGSLAKAIGSLDLTGSNFVAVYTNWQTLVLFGRSLLFAVGSAFVSLVMGGAAAWLTQKTDAPLKSAATAISIISVAIPGLFLAMSWVVLAAPRAGLINVWLAQTFNLPDDLIKIYSLPGMIWVEGLAGAPFTYLLLAPILRSMDRSLEEAASVSGSGAWNRIVRISLPLAVPAIFSILILRLVRGFEAFDVPAILGLPKGIDVLSTKIYTIVNMSQSYGVANAYALGLIVLAVAGIYSYQRLIRQGYKYATVTGKGYQAAQTKLGPYKLLGAGFLVFYVLVVAAVPLSVLLWNSIIPSSMLPSGEAISQLTLQNFRLLFNMPRVLLAFRNTFIIGLVASAGCVALALVASWILVRTRIKGRWLLDVFSFVPLTIPGITLGVALIWIYLTLPLPVYGTIWILVIGYATSFLPIAMRFLSPALVQINVELEEAASTSGASQWAIFRRILAPLILPAALGAALYVFLLIFRVLSMAIVVYNPRTIVLPVQIFVMWGEARGNTVYALLVVTLAILTPFAFLYNWLIHRYARGASPGA
ncbi:MAG: iron ABC transporter permease [Chloroflexi bacterium]|nr:iron ABC transporter permease [Chloroflexota bacterium]